MIEIRRLDGGIVLVLDDVPEGALAHRELMTDDYVKLAFSLAESVYFRLGDYFYIDGFGRYELTEPYVPECNVETGGYDYSMQFDAHYIKWKNKKVRYMPDNASSETSFHLTATADVHLGVIVKGLNAIGDKDPNFRYEGNKIEFRFVGISVDNLKSAKYKLYNDEDYISALNALADIYDCEWWVEDNVIYFGKCRLPGEAVIFELNENVERMSRSESKKEYATRVIAFGSERNLPNDYRKATGADLTKQGVVQKRLMLPLSGEHGCPYGYVEDDDVRNETEAVEAIFIDEDVYPRTQCVVERIELYTDSYMDDESGEEVTQTYYRLYDGSGFKFSTDYILEGKTLHILFQSGRMNGMDFECQYSDEKGYYEVVVNEDYGRPLPDEALHPEEGDEFVIYNWDSTKAGGTGLIDAAEEELYESVMAKLDDMRKDPNTYTCDMMSDKYSEVMDKDSMVKYDLGQAVTLVNDAYFAVGRESRIIGYEIKLDIPYDTPQYIVGEATAYSRTADMHGQIEALTYNGNSYGKAGGNGGGSGVYIITSTSTAVSSDANVYSAKRSDRQFLKRDRDDTAYGKITFEERSTQADGVQYGRSYLPGMTGKGGMIDGGGNGELESLTLRRFLEVPELRYNRATVLLGDQWNAPGGGIIESVIPDTDSEGYPLASGELTLKLEEGEIGAVAEDDICMGYFHDFRNPELNAVEDIDDSRGNRTFAGFCTVYFRITEIIDAGTNRRLRYQLRGISSRWSNLWHPFDCMHFVAYGNFTNKERQTSAYSTRAYTRYLRDVSDWEFSAANIAMQFGDMTNLNVHGLEMKGYSAYLNNVYMTGSVNQVNVDLRRMNFVLETDGWLGEGQSSYVICSVKKNGDEDVTGEYSTWRLKRDSGNADKDAQWDAQHTSVGKVFNLMYSDLRIEDSRRYSTVFTVIASGEGVDDVTGSFVIRRMPEDGKDGKDGVDGQDGSDGKDGAGISAVNGWYVITAKSKDVTRVNTQGWVKGVFQQPTAEKMYAWKYTETTYTQGKAATYTECELICVYNAGVNPNLLEDTDFRDKDHLDAWDKVNVMNPVAGVTVADDYPYQILTGTAGVEGRNALRTGTMKTGKYIVCKEGLQQEIGPKLMPGTWYTLSFWARAAEDSATYTDITGGEKYPFKTYTAWLEKGKRYRLEIRGRVSAEAAAAGKSLEVHVYKADWSWSKKAVVSTTTESTAGVEFADVPETGEYVVGCYVGPRDNGKETATVSRIYLRDLGTNAAAYIYPSCIDTSVKGYVNGEESTLTSDGYTAITINGSFRKYTYTFKTKSALPSGVKQNVLFRLFPAHIENGGLKYMEVCMPKLEVGMTATGYMSNEKSLRGDDGERGVNGCIERIFDEYTPGQVYYNDYDSEKEGIKYLDYIAIEDASMASGYKVYQCKATHTGALSFAADKGQWTEVGVNASSAFFTHLIAKNGTVKMLSSSKILISDTDTNGQTKVVAGLANEDYPLWIGGNVPESAPFRVDRKGKMTATGADIQGTVYAEKGAIGGWVLMNRYMGSGKVTVDDEGNYELNTDTEGLSLADNYIAFNNRDDSGFRQAWLGTYRSALGGSYLCRLVDTQETYMGFSIPSKVGIVFDIQNASNANFAFGGNGNGALNGFIEGYAYKKQTIASQNTRYDITYSKRIIVRCDVSNGSITLPMLSVMRMALGIGTSTPFMTRITILGDFASTKDFRVYGRNSDKDSSGKTPWNSDNYPVMINSNGGYWDYWAMGPGDSFELMLVYDPERTDTLNNYDTKYTAMILGIRQN